jgi:replicative DNA helicase
MATRVPPHNINAEESLLGAMLLSRDAVNTASESGISVEHFYKPAHQHVFDAMRSLLTVGEPVDPVTVADELRRGGLPAEAPELHARHRQRGSIRQDRARHRVAASPHRCGQ